jgi:hypothetical protein
VVSVRHIGRKERSTSHKLLTGVLLVYILAGTLLMNDNWYRVVPGAVVAAVGVGYAVLEFIPSIEPPSNMREADNGWGAEQV